MKRRSRLLEVALPIILVLGATDASAQSPATPPTQVFRITPPSQADGPSGPPSPLASPSLPPSVGASKWFSLGPFAGVELTGSSPSSGPKPSILAGVLWLYQAGTWQRVYLEPPRQGAGAVPAR